MSGCRAPAAPSWGCPGLYSAAGGIGRDHPCADPDTRHGVRRWSEPLLRVPPCVGHPLCDPHLLAQQLAGSRTSHPPSVSFLAACRPGIWAGRRRSRRGVLTEDSARCSRSASSSIDSTAPLPLGVGPPAGAPSSATGRDATGRRADPLAAWAGERYRPCPRAGCDRVGWRDQFDVAIIVSLDRDLNEIPVAVRKLAPLLGRPLRLEAAVQVQGDLAIRRCWRISTGRTRSLRRSSRRSATTPTTRRAQLGQTP